MPTAHATISSTVATLVTSLAMFACSSGEFSSGTTSRSGPNKGKQNSNEQIPVKTLDNEKTETLETDPGGDPSTIPGIQAQKIGVSFEDGTDNDYNDVSICFDAPFKVAPRNGLPPKVVMAAPKGQSVKVYLKSITGRIPTVTIRIFDQNDKMIFEKTKAYSTGANTGNENPVGPFFEAFFPFGSRIYVEYRWLSTALHTDGPGKVLIESNICRNTGI
jgi:hypothetical protein